MSVGVLRVLRVLHLVGGSESVGRAILNKIHCTQFYVTQNMEHKERKSKNQYSDWKKGAVVAFGAHTKKSTVKKAKFEISTWKKLKKK